MKIMDWLMGKDAGPAAPGRGDRVQRRAAARAKARQKRKGQRAYARQQRLMLRRNDLADAMLAVANDPNPLSPEMQANVRRTLARGGIKPWAGMDEEELHRA
jgi:hypothetical protein